ncbi:hypothetical protein C8Q76DRAFT_802408 [Earliella scabrosa]|nr:hypothetical protein C8Q76DRAFT_802408 [Earliella scabrosa]
MSYQPNLATDTPFFLDLTPFEQLIFLAEYYRHVPLAETSSQTSPHTSTNPNVRPALYPPAPEFLRKVRVTYDHLPRPQSSIGADGSISDRVGWVVVHPDLQGLVDRRTQTVQGAQLWLDLYRHAAKIAPALKQGSKFAREHPDPCGAAWKMVVCAEDAFHRTIQIASTAINRLTTHPVLPTISDLLPPRIWGSSWERNIVDGPTRWNTDGDNTHINWKSSTESTAHNGWGEPTTGGWGTPTEKNPPPLEASHEQAASIAVDKAEKTKDISPEEVQRLLDGFLKNLEEHRQLLIRDVEREKIHPAALPSIPECPPAPPPTPSLTIDDVLQYPSDDEDDTSTVGVIRGKPGKSLAEKRRTVAEKFKAYEAEYKNRQDKGKGKAV